MAVDTVVDAPQSNLSGVARVLVHAGKLSAKSAEELTRGARERRISFVSAVIGAGAVPPADLAHTLSSALALPLIDLAAVDSQEDGQHPLAGLRITRAYQADTVYTRKVAKIGP